jgi:hypothetical protein
MTDKTSLPGAADLTDERMDEIMRVVQAIANRYAFVGDAAFPRGREKLREVLAALSAPAVEPVAVMEVPSDGDYLRWAQREGASVNWESEHRTPRVSFASSAQWGRFCDRVRAAGPPPASQAEQAATQAEAPKAIGFSGMWLAPIDGTAVLLHMPTTTDKFAIGQWHGDAWGDDEGNYYVHEPKGWMSLDVLSRIANAAPTAPTGAQAEPWDDNPDGIKPGEERGPRMNRNTGQWE